MTRLLMKVASIFTKCGKTCVVGATIGVDKVLDFILKIGGVL